MSLFDWKALASCLLIIFTGINLPIAMKYDHYIALLLWVLFIANLIWNWQI